MKDTKSKTEKNPEVGMGATITHHYTVIDVKVNDAGEPNFMTVQEDNVKRTAVGDNNESYEFSRNQSGKVHHFKKNRKGQWQEAYRNAKTGRYNFPEVPTEAGLVLGKS